MTSYPRKYMTKIDYFDTEILVDVDSVMGYWDAWVAHPKIKECWVKIEDQHLGSELRDIANIIEEMLEDRHGVR